MAVVGVETIYVCFNITLIYNRHGMLEKVIKCRNREEIQSALCRVSGENLLAVETATHNVGIFVQFIQPFMVS